MARAISSFPVPDSPEMSTALSLGATYQLVHEQRAARREFLLDEQADQLFAMTDPMAERVRKIGGITLHSTGQIGKMQRVKDNNADYVEPLDMFAELREDNGDLARRLREAHGLCDKHEDVATASLIENWIDQAERRVWFLYESSRAGTPGTRAEGASMEPCTCL